MIHCFVHTVAVADLWRRDRCCGKMMMQPHRGMLGKASSKKTAATCVPPALHKAIDELKWRKEALIIFMFMFPTPIWGWILGFKDSYKNGYLLATLSHLNPSGSWGWPWKSPGQHRRNTPSHTLLLNSISASATILQKQPQCFGFHASLMFVFHLWDICQEDYIDSTFQLFVFQFYSVWSRDKDNCNLKVLIKKGLRSGGAEVWF